MTGKGESPVALLSQFLGILIHIQFEDHNPPHFHAYYQGVSATFLFNGEVLKEGKKKIPAKQKAFIKAWALLHEDELAANWYLAQNAGEPFKIKGLE
jgi:hypothetical protein